MRGAVACVAAAAIGCSGARLGSSVEYQVSERPLALPDGVAGSCMPRAFMSYPEIQSMKWAVGTNLEVEAAWPERQDCTRSLAGTGQCPAVAVSATAINAAAWTVTQIVGGAEANLRIRAIGAGDGGFALTAGGTSFTPRFVLHSTTPAAIWFELARGPRYEDVIPGQVTEVHLQPGGEVAVAVTLRTGAGEHVCGPVAAGVVQTGSAFTLDRLLDSDFVNLPYRLIAADTPGEASLQFTVGALTASLRVIVSP